MTSKVCLLTDNRQIAERNHETLRVAQASFGEAARGADGRQSPRKPADNEISVDCPTIDASNGDAHNNGGASNGGATTGRARPRGATRRPAHNRRGGDSRLPITRRPATPPHLC